MSLSNKISIASVLIAFFSLILAFYSSIRNDDQRKSLEQKNQSIVGDFNQIAGGDIVSVIQSKKNTLPESCNLRLLDLKEDSDDRDVQEYLSQLKKHDGYFEYIEGVQFNNCISRNLHKIVRLDIWLDSGHKEDIVKHQEFHDTKSLYFYVPETHVYNGKNVKRYGGHEYIVDMGSEYSDTSLNLHSSRLRTIKGFFKISDMDGPWQGVFSVGLVGVRIEDI